MQLFQQLDARTFKHRVDARGRISHVNDEWLDFAAENGWPISAADVVGRPLMEFIGNPELHYLYGLLLARLRAGRGPVRYQYRCDAPDCRRFMQMVLQFDPETREIEFASKILSIERRAPQAILNDTHAHDDGSLDVCSCCKRVNMAGRWTEIEDAVVRLNLLGREDLPRINHSVCQDCVSELSDLAHP
jgi:hypothetical protein